MNTANNTIATGPQNGSNTHHHDQSITPVNFSTMNTTPNSPVTPIPELLAVELLMLICLRLKVEV